MILTAEWLKEKGIKHTVSPKGLISVPGSLYLSGTQITSLGKLTKVGGDLYLYGTPITSLGVLTKVGGYLYLSGTPITSLGKLTKVGWSLYADGLDAKTLEGFKSMVATYKMMDAMEAPRARLLAEHPWQKKVCEEILEAL